MKFLEGFNQFDDDLNEIKELFQTYVDVFNIEPIKEFGTYYDFRAGETGLFYNMSRGEGQMDKNIIYIYIYIFDNESPYNFWKKLNRLYYDGIKCEFYPKLKELGYKPRESFPFDDMREINSDGDFEPFIIEILDPDYPQEWRAKK